MAKDETVKAYRDLVKQIKQNEQNAPCRLCQQLISLRTNSGSSPVVSRECSEIRQYPGTPSRANIHASYDNRATTYPEAAVDLTAQSTFLDDEPPSFLSPSLSAKSIPSDSDGSSTFTHVSPILTSRHTQSSPASAFPHTSQVCTSQHASATRSDLPQDSRHRRGPPSPALCLKQKVSSNRRRGDLLGQSSLAHGDAQEGSSELSEGNLRAETLS